MDLKDFKGRYPDGLENKDDENQDDENQDWVVFEARDTRKGQVVGWVWKGPLSWKAPGLFSLPLNRSYGADRTIAVYRLCCAVREVLTKLVEGLGKRSPWSLSVGAIAERNLWVDENGDVVIEPDAFYDGFLPALAECGAQRIKRCPIPKCAKFFWAKPKNKGACDQHLGLARVWRKRGKIPQYNESRRFRREKKLRGVRGNNYKQKQLLGLNRALTKGGDD